MPKMAKMPKVPKIRAWGNDKINGSKGQGFKGK
jgi:hypothetical protein